MKNEHGAGRGRRKAASFRSERTQEALREFAQLNSREAKAAFADHWISVWAEDFDQAWPMAYELLSIVEEDRLYADPRRVGPAAPGDAHGEVASYPSFAAYFEDRVRQPFARWAELEGTYHYAQRYAPELLEKALSEAVAQRMAALDGKIINDEEPGPIQDPDIIRITDKQGGGGTSAEYLTRRIKRDHPEIAARMRNGEYTSVRKAALDAGIIPRTLIVRQDDVEYTARSLLKHMAPGDIDRLIELLMAGNVRQ